LKADFLKSADNPNQEIARRFSEQRQKDYQVKLEDARKAFKAEARSPWVCAYALLDLQNAYRARFGNSPENQRLADELGIGVTPQRIGQLLSVAERINREYVVDGVPLKTYELMMEVEGEKRFRITEPASAVHKDQTRLADFIKQHPDPDYWRKILKQRQKDRRAAKGQQVEIIITLKFKREVTGNELDPETKKVRDVYSAWEAERKITDTLTQQKNFPLLDRCPFLRDALDQAERFVCERLEEYSAISSTSSVRRSFLGRFFILRNGAKEAGVEPEPEPIPAPVPGEGIFDPAIVPEEKNTHSVSRDSKDSQESGKN